MNNKQILIEAIKNLNKAKAPARKKDVVINQRQPSYMQQTSLPTAKKGGESEEREFVNSQEHGIDTPIYADLDVRKSKIHGQGVFSNQPIKEGTVVGISHVRKEFEKDGEMYQAPFPSKILGLYNHNKENPNITEIDNGDYISIIAIRNIQPGEELIANYYNNDIKDLEKPEDFKNELAEAGIGGSVNNRVLRDLDRDLKDPRRSRRFSKSLLATNQLFAPNYLFNKPSSRRIYNPNAKYFRNGGFTQNDLINYDGPRDYSYLLDEAYSKFPGLEVMKDDLKILGDPSFTRDATGIGDIEFFGKNDTSFTYPTGLEYPNPNPGGYGIPFNPKTTNSQGIALDMLHGMDEASPEYKKLKKEFGTAFMNSKFKKDFEEEVKWLKKEVGEDKYNEWYDSDDVFFDHSYIDGIIRNLLYEGTAEDFKRDRYWDKAQEMYLADPGMKETFGNLKKHLTTEPVTPDQYIQAELSGEEIQKYVDGGYIVEEVKLPKAKFGFGVPKLPNGIPKLPNGFKGFKGIDISKPKSLGNLTTNQLENILKYADVSDAYQNNVVNSEQLKAVIKAGENAHAQLFDDKVVSYLAQNSEDPMKFTVPGENFDLDAIRALPQHIAYHALHGSNISNMLRNSVEDYVRDPYAMFDLNFENDLEKMSELNGGTIRFPIKEVYHGFGSDADFNFENLELDRSKIPVEKLKTNTTTGKSSKFANWKLGEDIIGPRSKHQFGLYASYNLQGLRDPASSYSDNALSNSLALRLRPEEALKDTRSLIKNIELDDNVKLLHVGYKDENNNLKVKEIFRDILDIGKDNIGLPTFAGGISGDLNLTPKAAKRLKEKYDYDGLIYPSFGELVITNKDVIKGVKDRDFKMFDYQNPLDYYMSSLRTSNANLDKMLNVTGGLRNLTTLNDYYHPEYSRFRLPKDGPSRAWPQIEVPSYWPTDDPSSKRLQDELLGNWFRQKFVWGRGASDNVSSYIHDKNHPDFPIKDREYNYPFDESWYEKLHPENLPFIKKEGGELLKANGGKIIKTVLKPPKSPIKTRIGTNLKNLNLTKNSYFSDINNAISFYKPRIDNIVNEQLKWIESPEYIKRREATTGESKEEIVNSVKKQSEILNLIDLNKSFNIKPLSEGVLGSAQVNNKSFLGNKIFGAKPQINLDQNMFFTDPLQTLGTAKHETIHLSDPFFYSGTEFPFETAYNNYPFLNIDKPNLTFGQKFMNKFIDPSLPNNLISNKDLKEELSDWEYNIDKMEQKVRFKKLNDVIRQDLGLGKMYGSQPQLTIDNINKWISDRGTPLELSNYLDNSGLYDVNALLKGHSKSKDYSRTNLLDQLNKAWGLAAPLGLGLGYTMDEDSDSSYKYGGSLPKAKWGISGASWPPKFNLPFHSGLKYNKNGSISKIYNPYFKKWQEPRANVNALNELLNIGHANRELANEWNIRDINNIAKKSLQIIDPKKYDKESTLEYVKWHQEFAKLKESTIDKVADLKIEGNPLPPHEQRDLYEKFNSWLSVNTPPLQLDHMRNTSYSGLRDLSDKSKELVNRQIDDLNPHFDNFNIRKKYDLGINNMFKKLSFLEKLKSFRPKHDFGSSMYDSIAEDYNNVRDVWERDYPSINKEREMLEKLREYDLSTEPSQQKMIDDYQELFHNIMTPLQHTDIDLPNDGDELIGFQNGGVVELGDEVDEPTMQRLKKQGYTFEKV